jgi:hypothetical protein
VPDPRDGGSTAGLRWAYNRILWLGATILLMLAVGLIAITLVQPGDRRQQTGFQITLALGVNFLTGAVGAALFEILIRRPQERERQIATRSDVDEVAHEIDRSGRQLRELKQDLDRVTSFVARHEDFDYLGKLESLEQAEISDVFASRPRAFAAMHESAQLPRTTEISVLGITLSDFVTGKEGSPWSLVDGYLRGHRPLPTGSTGLSVRVLICDPHSLGARLFRAPVPGGGDGQLLELEHDIRHATALLRSLRQAAEARTDARVSLEFRFCRALPQCFLFVTDHAAYVQPYYLLQTAGDRAAMPVLRYDADADMRKALARHFDTLWSHASARPDDLIDGKPVRIERGAAQSGLVEIFTNAEDARSQMARLVANARRRVWIQGISNVPFLERPLNAAFEKAAHREGVDVRVLILDPRGRYAIQKTFALFQTSGAACARDGWDAYLAACADGAGPHQSSGTVRNIRRSLEWFSRVADAANTTGHPDKVSVRLTASVESFMLVADDHVLLEPYHYGDGTKTEFQAQTPLQLAEDMPLFEFHLPRAAPFPARLDERSDPVRLCETHLDRVFREFSTEVPPDLLAG